MTANEPEPTPQDPDAREGQERGTQGGPWAVVDDAGTVLEGRWPTEQLARDEGLCGRYLLSGVGVINVEEAES